MGKGRWVENDDDIESIFDRFGDEIVIPIAIKETSGPLRVLTPLKALMELVDVDVGEEAKL